MSWQKRSIPLILGLPFTLPMLAHAVNIGDTYVQSQQNQPLNASINVSDIDPATFSVKLAGDSAYQQLGLSNDANLQVQFQPTSINGGKIVITSNKPLTTPFTDVVLDVTNKGETRTLPKTLLLPIDNNNQVVTQSNTQLVEVEPKTVTIGSNNPVNLPVIDEPVSVSTNEPAPLPTAQTDTQLPVVATNNSQETLKGNLDPSKNLLVQETRRIYPAGTAPTSNNAINSSTTTEPLVTANTPETPTQPTQPTQTVTTTDDEEATTGETVTYVIQRNDNLWTIANQLAKQNKTDVNKVMKDIVDANPNAFEDNDPAKLIANSELQVPKYKVMPSQLGIKSANAIKKQTRITTAKTSKKPVTKSTSNKPTLAKRKTTTKQPIVARQVTKRVTKTTTTPVNRPVVARRTEMKIIAPSQNNGSNQGAIKADKNVGKDSQSSQIVTQVQQKRQVTADQASKVGQLNQSLVSAEKRLKLQNAKLAQLEERLKELNKK